MSKRTLILIVVMDAIVVAIVMYLIFGSGTIKNETGMDTEALTDTQSGNSRDMDTENVITAWYAPLIPLTLGSESLQASVADSDAERQQGLSNTPYLPEGIVKLFIFETDNQWGFWMKDMLYPIDMVWLDADKIVVHVEQNVTPDSYPTSFASPVPARYVIETRAGFTEAKGIALGTKGVWEN